jgi:hypothetical protein
MTVLERTMTDIETSVRARVFGHWAGEGPGGHRFCACPTPPASIGVRLGDRAERLVELLVRFGRGPVSVTEQTEMLALIQEAMP